MPLVFESGFHGLGHRELTLAPLPVLDRARERRVETEDVASADHARDHGTTARRRTDDRDPLDLERTASYARQRTVGLGDVIGAWIGRVEIAVAGAETELRDGQDALAAGDPLAARAAARRVLARAPDAPLGLALLADACEAAHLDAELALTLEELARRVPSSPDVWLRLARARAATGSSTTDVRAAFGHALSLAESGSDVRREAILALFDMDANDGQWARAELWIERIRSDPAADVVVRRARARLAAGDAQGALTLLAAGNLPITDGQAALLRGEALSSLNRPDAIGALLRAYVLDAPGAGERLADALARLSPDPETVERVDAVATAKGDAHNAIWRASLALARGLYAPAIHALREHPELAARSASAGAGETDGRRLASALARDGEGALDEVAEIQSPGAVPWARALASDIIDRWVPRDPSASSSWSHVVGRLRFQARMAGDSDATARLDDLANETSRPLQLTIAGEFNAGKSTFLNALMGRSVAAVGIVPTTSELQRERWRPEVEVVDTPGFNSLDPAHARAAHEATTRADVVLWLFDAAQALKESERAALERIQSQGVPFVVALNKTDRLSLEQRRTVLDSITAGLFEAKLSPLAPPVAVSAKLAAAGKQGDASALEASGWSAMEASLDRAILGSSARLKERALRRRAMPVVERLLEAARARARHEEEQALGRSERRRAAATLAAQLEADAEPATAQIARALTAAAAPLEDEMRLLLAGRDAESAARDSLAARYRADRAVAVLAPVLARELANWAGVEPRPAIETLEPALRALVRGALGSTPPGAPPPFAGIARAGLATWIERLLARENSAEPASPSTGAVRELEAFAAALAFQSTEPA
jgi:small GTP-binding protein